MRRSLARLGVLLVCGMGLGAFGAGAAPAAAAPGFDLSVTELPGTFRAGAGAERIAAVVSTTNDDGCRKVRWSMLVRVQGLRLDQVRVDRIEQDGSFPVQVSTEGNTARVTDERLDPGTLCRDRTVTAQYQIAVTAEATEGRITFTPEAYDREGQLLATVSATRDVVNDRAQRNPADRDEREAAETTPPADAAPAEPGDGEAAQPGGAAGEQADTGGAQADATAGTSGGGAGLVTIGFVVGGLMLFLGVGLLLRLRQRGDGEDEFAMAPNNFRRSTARTVPRRGGGWGAVPPGRGGVSHRRRPTTTRY